MRKSLLKLSIILVAGLMALLVVGCKPRIRLPEDTSLSGTNQWLAVSSMYTQMKSAPSGASEDLGILRRGTVLKIVESAYSSFEQDRGTLWFKVRNSGHDAWISAADSNTFSSEAQAKQAALRMK